MSAWTPCGYPVSDLFAGAFYCRFRLTHQGPNGLVVQTLGDQRSKGGRLEPVTTGFHYLSVVARLGAETGEVEELERAAANDHRTALAQHMALLDAWEHREPQEA